MNRRTFLDCAGRITTCCGAALALSQVGRPVQVELVRSVHRGDRECRFTVRF